MTIASHIKITQNSCNHNVFQSIYLYKQICIGVIRVGKSDDNKTVKSIFKSDDETVLKREFTKKWIEVINASLKDRLK